MIGRGSRKLPTKDDFLVVDLGNNAARFGLWTADIDWQKIFKAPDLYLLNLATDEDIERKFRYVMPKELRALFPNSEIVDFDIKKENEKIVAKGLKSSTLLEKSIEIHAKMIVENSDEITKAFALARLLEDEIHYRVKQYCYLISKSTRNYREWLLEDYMKRLKKILLMKI